MSPHIGRAARRWRNGLMPSILCRWLSSPTARRGAFWLLATARTHRATLEPAHPRILRTCARELLHAARLRRHAALVRALRAALLELPVTSRLTALDQFAAGLQDASFLYRCRSFRERAPQLARIDFDLEYAPDEPFPCTRILASYVFTDLQGEQLGVTDRILENLDSVMDDDSEGWLARLRGVTGCPLQDADEVGTFLIDLRTLCHAHWDLHADTTLRLRPPLQRSGPDCLR